MAKKQVLGKGLGALLPNIDPQLDHPVTDAEIPHSRLYRFEDKARLAGRVAEVDVDAVRPNPYQPRRDFDEAALDELADSIRELGVIQPVTVRVIGENVFELISGERRWRAARKAGVKKLPAFIREANTEEMLEMAIVENVQREDLNPIDVAFGYERLMDECGLTQEQVAKKVSKNRSTVANFLRLLKLPPVVQAALRQGKITNGHARALLSLPDKEAQTALLKKMLAEEWSVRQIEEAVKKWNEPKPAKPPAKSSPTVDELQIRDFTNRLRSHMSTRVQISNRQDGSGKIEIGYFSSEDLERLLDLILNQKS